MFSKGRNSERLDRLFYNKKVSQIQQISAFPTFKKLLTVKTR